MKKYLRAGLLYFTVTLFCASCRQIGHGNNVSLTVSDSEEEYEIRAHYPEGNTAKVAAYLNQKLGKKRNISFSNTKIDAELTLDDGTKLYMKKEPGDLEIQLNKEDNTVAAYHTMQALVEGLKPLLNE